MPDLDPIRQKYILDVSSVVAGSKQVVRQQHKMNALNRELYGSFRLAIRRAGAAAFAVLLGSIYKAVQGFTRFQKEMAEVETLINSTTASIGHLSEEVRRLARVTPLALSDLTRGLYQTISAAVPAEEAMQFLGTAARAAVGGVTEVAVAVDGMTSVLNAFAFEAKDAEAIADTFFVTVRDGKTTFAELSKNIGTVAPSAAALGLSFESLSSAIAAMTLQGLTTDKATVALRGFFKSLEDPADEAIALAKQLGIEYNAQALAAKGIVPFLTELKTKTDAYSGAITVLVGNSRAANGVNALLNSGLDDLVRIQGDMADKTGQANEAFRKLNVTGDTTWEVFKNRVGDALNRLGEKTLPLVNELVRALNSGLNAMRTPADRIADVFAMLGIEVEGASEAFDRLLIAQTKAELSSTSLGIGVKGEVFRDWRRAFQEGAKVVPREQFFPVDILNTMSLEDQQKFASEKIGEILDIMTSGYKESARLREEDLVNQDNANEKQLTWLAVQLEELGRQVAAWEKYYQQLEKVRGAEERLAKTGTETPVGGGVTRPKITLREEDADGIRNAIKDTVEFQEKMRIAAATTEQLRDALDRLSQLRGDQEGILKGVAVLESEIAAKMGEQSILQVRLRLATEEQREQSEKELAAKNQELAVLKDQLSALKNVEESAVRLKSELDAIVSKWENIRGITEETQDHFKAIEEHLDEITRRRLKKAVDEAEEFRDAMQDAAEAMSAVARVMRDLGVPDLAGVADSISGLLGVLPSLRAAGGIGFGSMAQTAASLSTVASIASLGVSIGSAIASALGGSDPSSSGKLWDQRRERDQIIKDAAETFKRAAETIANSATAFSGVAPDVFDTALSVAQRAQRSGLRPTRFPTTPLTEEQMRRLAEAPTREEFFEALSAIPGFEGLEEEFQALVNTGLSQEKALQEILDRALPILESINLGVSGANLSGLERELQIGRDFLGDTPQQSFDRMIDFLGGMENLPEHIRNVLLARSGLDISTPEGQAALAQLIEGIAQNLLLGNTFGLSAEEIENILLPLLDSFRADLGDIDSDISRSVIIQRTITEIQANELLAIQESALLTLERILDAISMGQSEGNTYNISIDIPADTTDFGRRILEEIEQEIRLKEAS